MIIWSGSGILVLLIAFLGAVLGVAIEPAVGLPKNVGLGLGLILAAIANWFVGQSLNSPSKARTLVDPKTGQKVIFRPRNSLFWIPMQWWSVAMVFFGLPIVILPFTGIDSKPKAPMAKAGAIKSPVAKPAAPAPATEAPK
jgi:hypothetical protein